VLDSWFDLLSFFVVRNVFTSVRMMVAKQGQVDLATEMIGTCTTREWLVTAGVKVRGVLIMLVYIKEGRRLGIRYLPDSTGGNC
jgi:hypothetical protein